MANVKATDLIEYTRASEGYALAKVSYGEELVSSSDRNQTATSTDEIVGVEVDPISVEIGKIYFVSATVTATSTGTFKNPDWGVGEPNIDPVQSNTFDLLNEQDAYEDNVETNVYGTVIPNQSTIGVAFRVGGDSSGDNTLTVSNISVKEVTFNQADGTLQLFQHPDNIPRIEYDADGNLLGLLIEEQRTNNITNSESCSFVDESGGTVTASTTPAPYGASSTVKRIQSSTLNGGGKLQVTILTGGDNYCSVYVRSRTGADQNLKITASGTTGATQVAPASGDWVRLGRVASLGAGSRDMRVLSTGDTIDLDIALPQVELGSFPTSYIKTTGSTASRSADVAKIEVDQFGYNQSEGTLVVEWKQSIGAASYVAMLSDGTAANRSFVRQFANGSAYYSTITNNVAQGDVLTGTVVDNQSNKIGVVYKYNDAAGVLNGASAVTDATSLVPEGVSTLSIGSYTVGSSQYINGHIKSIQYYPRRLTNAQLQDLTS